MAETELSALVGKVALGDREAYSEVYAALAPAMYALARQMLGRGAAADEALEAALVALWQEAREFSTAGLSPFAWAVGLTRRECIARRAAAEDLPDLPEAVPFALSAEEVEPIDPAAFEAIRRAWFEGEEYPDLANRFGARSGETRDWLRWNLTLLAEVLAR